MTDLDKSASPILIAPSILSADFANLATEVDAVISDGADWIHFDAMDNHFVPNLTIGPGVLKSLRRHTGAVIDAHLMVSPTDSIAEEFVKAGATIVTIHTEATDHIDRTLSMLRSLGVKTGLAFNPATPLSTLEYVISKVDLILIMSVNPGFGGQKFIPEVLPKVAAARKMIDAHFKETGHAIDLEVDGGVGAGNAAALARAGANVLVAGSAVFGKADASRYRNAISAIRDAALSGLKN